MDEQRKYVSRAMMERYSHIRMEAKRKAVDTLEPVWHKIGAALPVRKETFGLRESRTLADCPPRAQRRLWRTTLAGRLID